jgi:hypothetical protein
LTARPFRPLRDPSTLSRYASDWSRMLAYVLRSCESHLNSAEAVEAAEERSEKRREMDCLEGISEWVFAALLTGVEPRRGLFPLTAEQRTAIDGLWEIFLEGLGIEAVSIDSGLLWQDGFDDRVRVLSVSLIRQPLEKSRFHSPMLSYVGARALNAGGGWKFVGSFTGILSGLVHGLQLWILIQSQRESFEEGSSLQHLLKEMCDDWLVNTGRTPAAELNGIRLLGLAIARDTPSEPSTYWNKEGSAVTYLDRTLEMDQLRRWVAEVLVKAEKALYDDCLFAIEEPPEIDPSKLRDIIGRTSPGFSFVSDRRNVLQHEQYWLVNCVMATPSILHNKFTAVDPSMTSGVRWIPGQVRRYLAKIDRFLELLLVSVHLTSGMPARGPEILGLHHCNYELPRELFICNGRLMTKTLYHKLDWKIGSRPVCRFLTPYVGKLMATYLTFVLPFERFLQSQIGAPVKGGLIWCRDGREWKTDRLTTAMERESLLAMGIKINTATYRQLVTAMTGGISEGS